MRGDLCTFDDAVNLLDYLDELGVSHLYLSPILTAVAGSTHGYDVTDPTTVSAALGGAPGLRRLADAAHARNIGLIVDIVPNHMGVGVPQQNPWWWDVLSRGRQSRFADFFDIDWTVGDGRIVLPILGSDADLADLRVDGEVLRIGDLVLPIAAGTGAGSATQVHDRQHYRLTGWRNAVCGYRRFFSITSLAALRQEDRKVFDATHIEIKRWFDEGLVDGLRIDHPDGLTDPARYFRWLRELAGPSAWLVAEKILATDESLDNTLAVDGTTGYDALREIGGLFVDPAGARTLTELDDGGDHQSERDLKAAAVTETLHSELARLCRLIAPAAGPGLPAAVTEVVSRIGVYRSDYPSLAAVVPRAMAETSLAAPELDEQLTILGAALATDSEVMARFNQLCGAATAKAVEDCLFYRDARLVSLNEVGGAPEHFGVSAAEFQQRAANRVRWWPRAMTTLSTHDTKRGEDVRARIGVLSQFPETWSECVRRWEGMTAPPDRSTALFLWQNIFGVWPCDGAVSAELRDRLHAYAEKAMREAATRTSWHAPDMEFETAVHDWLDRVIDGPVADELTELVTRIDPHGRSDSLGQKLIQLTAPGVPDVYQGTELPEDSLVDPDNRRPVDFTAHRDALRRWADPKLRVTATALRLRRRLPHVFTSGDHRPVLCTGPAAPHVVSFGRGSDVLVAVSRWTARQPDWAHTALTLPEGTWTELLTDRRFTGEVSVAVLFEDLPVALMERVRD